MHSEDSARVITWEMDEISSPLKWGRWEKSLKEIEKRALLLVDSCREIFLGKEIEPQSVLSAIKEYESILEKGKGLCLMASLYKSSNVLDEKREALFQKVRQKMQGISDALTPIELQFSSLGADTLNSLVKSSELKGYRYAILRHNKFRPYLLSEPEERLIKSKNLSMRLGPVSRFDALIGSLSPRIKTIGLEVSIGKALSLFLSPDRKIRKDVFEELMRAFKNQGDTFLDILNILLLENNNESHLRGYPSPFHMSVIRNDIDPYLVNIMMDTVEKNYDLVSRYYSMKSRLMKIDDFKIFDISAPMGRKMPAVFEFGEARQIILEALGTFHPSFASVARNMFARGWIDAESRKEKQNGAFCKCLVPSQHPYISLKYTGSIRAVLELAHEIGHGIQFVLSSGKSYLNFKPFPVISETAATFVETLVSLYMLKNNRFGEVRDEILAKIIEGIILTVFRQNLITSFEKVIHENRAIRRLSKYEVCELWLSENHRLYGHSVILPPAYGWGWAHIPHIIHHHFYCYSYIFGCLVSSLLYERYQEDNKFAENIYFLFGSGASESPLELLENSGIRIDEKTSWDFFFVHFKKLIDSMDYTTH